MDNSNHQPIMLIRKPGTVLFIAAVALSFFVSSSGEKLNICKIRKMNFQPVIFLPGM